MPHTSAPHGSLASLPAFSRPVTNPFGLVNIGSTVNVTLADIDGDGDLDVLAGASGLSSKTHIFLNTGGARAPAFAAPVASPFGLEAFAESATPTFADIDGDGDLDAFIGDYYGQTHVQINSGSATAPGFDASVLSPYGLSNVGVEPTFPGDTSGYEASPFLADIDADGDLDAFIGDGLGNTLVFLNTGTAAAPAFSAPETNPYGLTNVGYRAKPNLVDIDGDGDLDAFIGEYNGNIFFYRNIGTASAPAFDTPVQNPFGFTVAGYVASPTFGDIDGDGDLDVLVGNTDGDMLLYLNKGTFVAPVAATANGTYGVGDVVTLSVTFSEPVFVDTTGGTPRLKLETGAIDRYAVYAGGSGTSTLSFTYMPQPGDTSADLDATGPGALRLDGGTIQDADGNNAVLTLAAPGAAGSLGASSQVVIDTGWVNLRGGALADVMSGSSGDDKLNGAGGNDDISGMDGSDTLTGGDGADTLAGGAGADRLVGGLGADSMTGGDGSDRYYVDDPGDSVVETESNSAIGGSDTVYTSLASYTLGANVEQGRITLAAGAALTGNTLANKLFGGAGNDTLDGGGGNDRLAGGAGADVFVFGSGSGRDTIADFSSADGDRIRLPGTINGLNLATGDDVLARTSNTPSGAVIQLGGGHTVKLVGVFVEDLHASDFDLTA